jgi:cytidylate kinase
MKSAEVQGMSIIIVSRGCYQRGSEVAIKTAVELGYECISREVLLEASKLFDIPELKLEHAIQDAPSLLERLGSDRKNYIAYIRTALLRRVQKDNVVYHGFAGHFFLQGIPAILKVRVFADLEQRVKDEMGRAGVSAEKARQTVIKDDEERRAWALSLYGMDTYDPTFYDMLLHIGTLTVDDAARIIAETAMLPSFQTTPESKHLLNDRVLASQVEALLLEEFPRVQVTARNGEAFVHIHTGLSIHAMLKEKQKVIEKVESIAISLGGAEKAHVSFDHPT